MRARHLPLNSTSLTLPLCRLAAVADDFATLAHIVDQSNLAQLATEARVAACEVHAVGETLAFLIGFQDLNGGGREA